MELTGAVWLVFELTDSAFLLGLLGIARALPGIVLSPMAGVISDRVDQRCLLFTTQAASLIALLVLGLLIVSGQVQLWQVYLQVAVQSAIGAFDGSVRQALFPRLVPRAHLGEAVTLHSIAGRVAQLIVPALGGLVIWGFGDASPFLANAASFLILMAAIVGMRGVVSRRPREGSPMRGELVEGLRHILGTPILAGLLKLEIVFGLFQINAVMITIFGRDVLGSARSSGSASCSSSANRSARVDSLCRASSPTRQSSF